jgi:hypothetical protein
MKLQVCTREEAESLPGRPNWVVISITDPLSAFGPAKLRPGWHAIHRVTFEDADPTEDDPDLHIMITDEDASGIVLFVYAHSNMEGFMVHCNRGIGRSQGVAAWIAEHFSIPEFDLSSVGAEFALDPRFNKFVLDRLRANA